MTNFDAKASDFLSATRQLKWLVPKKSTLPALEHIRTEPTKDGIKLVGTTLDCELQVTIPGTAKGFVHVPLHQLPSFTVTGDARVAFEVKGDKIEGRAGGLICKLPTVKDGDFAGAILSPGKTATAGATMAAETFGWSLDYVADAISTEETRFYLNGVFMVFDTFEGQSGLVTVATDGHKLFRCRIGDEAAPLGKLKPEGLRGILPRFTVELLRRLLRDLPDDGQKVLIRQYDNGGKMVIEASNWKVITKMIDGTFPDYQRVIPPLKGTFPVKMARDALASSLRTFGGQTHVNLDASGEEVLLSSSKEGVEGFEAVAAQVGKDIKVGINGRYLTEALDNCKEEIRLHFHDAGSPIRIDDPDQADLLMVIMPQRTTDITAPKALPKPKAAVENSKTAKPSKSKPVKKAA